MEECWHCLVWSNRALSGPEFYPLLLGDRVVEKRRQRHLAWHVVELGFARRDWQDLKIACLYEKQMLVEQGPLVYYDGGFAVLVWSCISYTL